MATGYNLPASMSKPSQSFFASSRLTLTLTLLVLFSLGLGIRLYDLTDLPLDFHPTRQLLSALKARGMFFQSTRAEPEWQRKMAIQQWRTRAEVEPEVFERLVAFTYRFTGVQLWVARIYASLFWVVGGIFLLLLIRDLISIDAAVIGTAYYLFLPYAVIASRSFQPDPLMVMLLVAFWWMIARWSRTQSWSWAILAGLVGGLAIFIKFVSAFFVIGAAIVSVLPRFKGRDLFRKPQIWVMMVLGVLPAATYIFYGVVLHSFLGRQFGGRFIPALLLSPANYLHWATLANVVAGGVAIALAALGVIFVRDRNLRKFLLGLWCGYILFGLFFDYHVATHDYYHLPLIPIVALSIAPLADAFMLYLKGLTIRPASRFVIFASLLYGLLAVTWDVRNQLNAVNYRPQAAMWAQIGEQLGHGPNVVALTQDYGSRLAYWGWQNAIIWPNSGDIDYHEVRGASTNFQETFSRLTTGNTYFLVTDFAELDRQPELKTRLLDFAVSSQGDGYAIYDLEKPASQ
jgi:hypothetical protein